MPLFPQIDAIVFRHYQADDGAAIYHLINACQAIDAIDPYSTLEGMPELEPTIRYLSVVDPENLLIAEKDGQVIGYSLIEWWTESDGITLYLHYWRFLPDFRSPELGKAFLDWSEARIRELAVEHESKPVYGANASSTEEYATNLLLENGYEAVFTLGQMVYRDLETLEELPLPEGVQVLPAEPEQAEMLWKAKEEAWAEKPVWGMPDVEREEAIDEIRTSIEKTGHLWKIIWVGDKVAAQVWCSFREYEGKKAGFLDEVHTVPEFRRQGLAALAINRALLMFREMGAFEGRLHTDYNNSRGARTLYEKVGFQTIKTFPRYRKDV